MRSCQLETDSGKSGKTRIRHGLNEVFKAAGSVVVAHYAGLTVAQMNDLRSKMRAAGGTVKVAKNRLAKIALQGTESEGIPTCSRVRRSLLIQQRSDDGAKDRHRFRQD